MLTILVVKLTEEIEIRKQINDKCEYIKGDIFCSCKKGSFEYFNNSLPTLDIKLNYTGEINNGTY